MIYLPPAGCGIFRYVPISLCVHPLISSEQSSLPEGATVAPVIIASDKTQLSTFSGDKQAWPAYLTIGNIDKSIRKSPSRRAMVLLGYLPASKLQVFSPSERSLQGYRLFHYAMSLLLEPLVSSGTNGIDIVCADGWIRRVFPIAC